MTQITAAVAILYASLAGAAATEIALSWERLRTVAAAMTHVRRSRQTVAIQLVSTPCTIQLIAEVAAYRAVKKTPVVWGSAWIRRTTRIIVVIVE